MKATDLMIGDWVHCAKLDYAPENYVANMQVKQLYVADIDTYSFKGLKYEEIEPIPLTADILKANGIELLAVGDNGVATPPKWRNRLEQWLIHTKWKDINLWYDRMTKKYRLQDTNAIEIEYVHQLQQTLRLAKIEKEIVI